MSSKSPSAYLWTPRLHPYEEDKKLWLEEPIHSVFHAQLAMRATRGVTGHNWEALCAKLQSTPQRMEDAMDWLAFCIGEDVALKIPGDAGRQILEVMLDVLYLRYLHSGGEEGEAQALGVLLKSQLTSFRTYRDIPAEFCFIDDIEEREPWVDTDSESESGSGSDYTMSDPGSDYAMSEAGNIEGLEELVLDFCQAPQEEGIPALPKRPLLLEPAATLPYLWFQHLQTFFYPPTTNLHIPRSKTHVVYDLIDMRKLQKRVWKTEEFQAALKNSGLLGKLYDVSEPGNLIETSHPDVEQSFRFYNWKASYPQMICEWTPATITVEEYEARKPKPDPNYRFTEADALDLLNTDPSKTLLQSLHPKLVSVIRETSSHRTTLISIRQEIWRSLPRADKPSVNTYPGIEAEEEAEAEMDEDEDAKSVTAPTMTEKSSKGAKRNAKKREKKKKGERLEKLRRRKERREMGVVETSCPRCQHEPMANHCMREVQVFRQAYAKGLDGAALTCAPPGDRLKPRGGKDGRKPFDRYVDPRELGIQWYHPRPDVYHRWYPGMGKTSDVGGVRYNAMSPKTLEQMIDNHRRVRVRAVRRRDAMQAWAHGSMTAVGTRQATGGRQADTYAPYACHKGDTDDDIKALFRHAVDADVLVEIGATIIPSLRADIIAVSNTSEVGRLGHYGLTSFYCSNYISAVHPDYDFGRGDLGHKPKKQGKGKGKGNQQFDPVGGCSPCVQLEQSGTDKSQHEWDFALPEWGVAYETCANTVWCFNGRHRHGSVHPSESSYNNQAASKGNHPTKRKKDVERAEFHRQQYKMRFYSLLLILGAPSQFHRPSTVAQPIPTQNVALVLVRRTREATTVLPRWTRAAAGEGHHSYPSHAQCEIELELQWSSMIFALLQLANGRIDFVGARSPGKMLYSLGYCTPLIPFIPICARLSA
ncbi:hypothetical protein B0H15DRAFT_799309 [Mycena belliarum]|uniref:Uncharacterized protein n=1 Tax=Mycena belliarum TaxID=1033014 RepID=A0AAD6U9V8_9AGAR|nr:hypothetical protein B0H15DRAFT_799303 [Mycena belliae]KAJ7092840.1 hypothetical protein B0H15DRAFT_799309 [Mycena belliae]